MLPISAAETALPRGPVTEGGHERRDGAAELPDTHGAFLTVLVAAVTPVAAAGSAAAVTLAANPVAPEPAGRVPPALRTAAMEDAGGGDGPRDDVPIPGGALPAVAPVALMPPPVDPAPARPQQGEADALRGRGVADTPATDGVVPPRAAATGTARAETGREAVEGIPPTALIADVEAPADAAPANGRPSDPAGREPARQTEAVPVPTARPGSTVRPEDAAMPTKPLYAGLTASPATDGSVALSRALPEIPASSAPPQDAGHAAAGAKVSVRAGSPYRVALAPEATLPTEVPRASERIDARPTGPRTADAGSASPAAGPLQASLTLTSPPQTSAFPRNAAPTNAAPALPPSGVLQAAHGVSDTVPREAAGIGRGSVETGGAGRGEAVSARPSAQGESPAPATAATTVPRPNLRAGDGAELDAADVDRQAVTAEPAAGPDTAIPHRTERAHPGAPHLPHALGHRLAEIVARFPDRPVEVTLSPEELGRVRMTLATHDGALTLAIFADRPETVDLMRRHIDQLAQDFRDLGFANLSFSFSHREGTAPDPRAEARADPAREEAAPPLPTARPPARGHAARDGAGSGLDLRM